MNHCKACGKELVPPSEFCNLDCLGKWAKKNGLKMDMRGII